MEKLFRGFVETTFSNLKKTYGMPIIENDRATWTITLNERDYEVYDLLPLESSSHPHKWRVDAVCKDLSDLEELFSTV